MHLSSIFPHRSSALVHWYQKTRPSIKKKQKLTLVGWYHFFSLLNTTTGYQLYRDCVYQCLNVTHALNVFDFCKGQQMLS